MRNAREVLIGLGSNIHPRAKYLTLALDHINTSAGRITQQSAIYEAASWGFNAADFLNMAVRIETHLTLEALLHALQTIERTLGRTRIPAKCAKPHYLPRTIDLDILAAGAEIKQLPTLTVPHPLAHLRRFVLTPLAEIEPNGTHPILGRTWPQLLAECTDYCPVIPYSNSKHSFENTRTDTT